MEGIILCSSASTLWSANAPQEIIVLQVMHLLQWLFLERIALEGYAAIDGGRIKYG